MRRPVLLRAAAVLAALALVGWGLFTTRPTAALEGGMGGLVLVLTLLVLIALLLLSRAVDPSMRAGRRSREIATVGLLVTGSCFLALLLGLPWAFGENDPLLLNASPRGAFQTVMPITAALFVVAVPFLLTGAFFPVFRPSHRRIVAAAGAALLLTFVLEFFAPTNHSLTWVLGHLIVAALLGSVVLHLAWHHCSPTAAATIESP